MRVESQVHAARKELQATCLWHAVVVSRRELVLPEPATGPVQPTAEEFHSHVAPLKVVPLWPSRCAARELLRAYAPQSALERHVPTKMVQGVYEPNERLLAAQKLFQGQMQGSGALLCVSVLT